MNVAAVFQVNSAASVAQAVEKFSVLSQKKHAL